jgi:DNA-binding CsgD family transcriptional regulator
MHNLKDAIVQINSFLAPLRLQPQQAAPLVQLGQSYRNAPAEPGCTQAVAHGLAPAGYELLALALDQLDLGVLICDEDGCLMMANDAARREIARGRPFALDSSGMLLVPRMDAGSAAQWHTALRGAARLQRRQMVALHSAEVRLTATVLPLGARAQPLALVLLGRRQVVSEITLELLGKLHDLTAAERRVLGALVNGQRLETMAKEYQVKLSTLRTQVASLRNKIGVRRVEELLVLAAVLPPMAGALRSPPLTTRLSAKAVATRFDERCAA